MRNTQFKTNFLSIFLLTGFMNIANAELSSDRVTEIKITSDSIIISLYNIPVDPVGVDPGPYHDPSCTLIQGGFELQNTHSMFDELYSLFLTARLSETVVKITHSSDSRSPCYIQEASF